MSAAAEHRISAPAPLARAPRELDGLVTVVTGAAAGIGEAIARLLASRGARVALFDVREDDARRLAAELEAQDLEAAVSACDVTRVEDVGRAVAETHRRFGRIDVLVNNAGGGAAAHKRPLSETDEATFDQALALNARSAFLCSRAVAPRLREQGGGSIVNMASDQAFTPTPGRAAYAAAKGAVVALTRALAVDLGPEGIRVNAVSPGATVTERTRTAFSDAVRAELAASHPLRRLAEPADVAEAVAFLAGPRSRHVTGHVLHVNGGLGGS